MKIGIRTATFVMLAGLVGASAAHAQVTDTMQFKTAFPFTVGNTTYPAGSFTVKPADDVDLNVMELSNGTTTTLITLEPEMPAPNQSLKDEVVFKKYGDKYVLSDIWDSAAGSGARAEMSTAEKRHAKKNGPPTKESVQCSKLTASGS
jgi:hypothetical protein